MFTRSYSGIARFKKPNLAVKFSLDSFARPLFVVIITTPFAAREPYSAVAAASFKTAVLSISSVEIDTCEPVYGTPSITYNGDDLAFTDPILRLRIYGFLPGDPQPLLAGWL